VRNRERAMQIAEEKSCVLRKLVVEMDGWTCCTVPLKGRPMSTKWISLRRGGVFYVSAATCRIAKLTGIQPIPVEARLHTRKRLLALLVSDDTETSWSLVAEKGGRKLHARDIVRSLRIDPPARLPIVQILPGLVIADYGRACTE